MVSSTVNEIALLAKNEGRPAIERRFRNQLPIFREDPASAESFYWSMKNELPAAACILAFFLRANKVVVAGVDADLERARQDSPGLWVTEIAHVLSSMVLSRAREAFEKSDVLCGLQRHYAGGSSPSAVVYNSFPTFEEHLRSTRPGDEFMLVSVQQLAARSSLLNPTPNAIKQRTGPLVSVFDAAIHEC